LNYSALDKLLHRMLLGRGPLAELQIDLNERFAGAADGAATLEPACIHIAGLARAGTTSLLGYLDRRGAGESLRYRDMPFVLAPAFWARLGLPPKGRIVPRRERMHADGLTIDLDTAEALEEPFWMHATGQFPGTSGQPTWLSPLDRNALLPLAKRYRTYVVVFLQLRGASAYLCKNNNNHLRLECLVEAFADTSILVVFREPAAHATSLLRQHRRFLDIQERDPFVLEYMNLIGHHEFGRGRLPFRYPDAQGREEEEWWPGLNPDGLDYWLEQWLQTYRYLAVQAERLPANLILVSHERLCRDRAYVELLHDRLHIGSSVDHGFFAAPRPAAPSLADVANPDRVRRARHLYRRLDEMSRSS
jgi:hypothetical protein